MPGYVVWTGMAAPRVRSRQGWDITTTMGSAGAHRVGPTARSETGPGTPRRPASDLVAFAGRSIRLRSTTLIMRFRKSKGIDAFFLTLRVVRSLLPPRSSDE